MKKYFTLTLLLVLASAGMQAATFRKEIPVRQHGKEEIVDVAVRRFKSTSSFARLKPEEKILDRLAVFCLHNFHLEKSLEIL